MADRAQDWSPPGALRPLLWWPPVAFLIAIALPGAGLLPIVGAGLALAVVGLGISAVSRRRRPATAEDASPVAALDAPEPDVGPMPLPQRRAA